MLTLIETKTVNNALVDDRPVKDVPPQELEKFRKLQKDGKLTVKQCCEQLGISRSKWYKTIAKQS